MDLAEPRLKYIEDHRPGGEPVEQGTAAVSLGGEKGGMGARRRESSEGRGRRSRQPFTLSQGGRLDLRSMFAGPKSVFQSGIRTRGKLKADGVGLIRGSSLSPGSFVSALDVEEDAAPTSVSFLRGYAL